MGNTFLEQLMEERDTVVDKRNKNSSSKSHYDYYSRQLFSLNNLIINKINKKPTT